MINEQKIIKIIRKLKRIIKYHKFKDVSELRKYIYIHNIDEETWKLYKQVFKEYEEMNVLNCVLSNILIKQYSVNEKKLVMKIKGIEV